MKDCIFRSPCHVFQPAQKCYRQYKVQVLDAVQNEHMSIRKAALEYDVCTRVNAS
jgi:hypothetical protein